MYHQDHIKSVAILLEVRSCHFIARENVLLLHHCDVMCHMHCYFCRTFLMTFCQWTVSLSAQSSDTDCNARVKSIYPSILELYQTSILVCLRGYPQVSVCIRLCVCPSAPGFALGSTSGQTVCPLPRTIHQGEGLTTTLLHGRIPHVSVGKVNLRIERTHMRV